MSKYSEILNLDLESLTTLSDVYFGYAGSLIKMEDSRYYPYIASCYTIAAIFKSIIKPKSGTESFLLAAKFYKSIGNSYWMVCSTCGYDLENVAEFSRKENSEISIYLLENILASAINDNDNNKEFHFSFSSMPIGRLNIPAKVYVDALEDISRLRKSKHYERFSFDGILSFLKRSGENTYLLKTDSFHWQNLYGNFIPLEPETLGFCIAICKKFKELGISIDHVFEQVGNDQIAKLPLIIADEICNRNDLAL